MFLVTRTETFCAAHRLDSKALGVEENQKIYGKCNWEGGHGHNYKVEVTVAGELDEVTGMVVNLSELKDCIWKYALDSLDHRNIDVDVEYFNARPSTTENVARYIWLQLVDRIPSPARLYKIKIYETDKNHATYRG
jgi:6-pyruvoyltetrahydropterin/6-carboxytetrahydropterin synthase